ncbi:MAG: hypothetical protein Q8N60_00585 [Candidatus Diapherotrites archaeon]|nr:hypothetical protein [Candidatus Diapherotrites archaeon]
MNKWIAFSFVLVMGIVFILGFPALSVSPDGPEQKRDVLLNELSGSIDKARLEGKYDCCIEPPCTMCYLGEWLWEDGICRCGEMIAKGEFDKVCPQCKKGIEEGRCISTNGQACPIKGVFE